MAVKNNAQLTSQITSTVKDNGGADATKTQGALHRVLEKDIIDSSFLKLENTVTKINTATIDFSADNISGGFIVADASNAPITASTITISAIPAPLNGKVVELIHRSGTPPSITMPSGWKLTTVVGGNTYVPNVLNRMSFQYFPGNIVALIYSEWTTPA